MTHRLLLALLYMADRESLGEVGRPIVGGPVIAARSGPCHKLVGVEKEAADALFDYLFEPPPEGCECQECVLKRALGIEREVT